MTSSAPPFAVRDARESDNVGLGALRSTASAQTGVRWSIRLGDDFFAPLRAEAEGWTVALAEDAAGMVLGCISVAVRTAWVLDRPRTTCYVTNFMVLREHRRRGIGDALCRRALELCEQAGGPFTPILSAVVPSNRLMRGRIRGHRGLPALNAFARVRVRTLATHRLAGQPHGTRFDVRVAAASDLDDMAALARQLAPTRQLAPWFSRDGLAAWVEGAPGLALSDPLVARERGRLVGWLGLWDEAPVRDVRVAGYAPTAAVCRVLRDVRARLVGSPRPPRVGERVASVRAVHVTVPADRPDVLRALAAQGARRCTSDQRWLKIALDERDPLARALDGLPSHSAHFDLHVATPSGSYGGPRLDDRPAHFEPALV